MSYDPRSQNYSAIEHNLRAQRNANDYVYDPYERVNLWTYIQRTLLATVGFAIVIMIVFMYVQNADAYTMPDVKLSNH